MSLTDSTFAARAFFPRGLAQPDGSFRFSADALLLAAFVVRRCLPGGKSSLLDLGCGCGVVGLACLLAVPDLCAEGVDVDADLIAAANSNAATLGLEDRFTAMRLDLASPDDSGRLAPASVDCVAANMPFRSRQAGRVPSRASRGRALFADETTMDAFLGNAARSLAPGGRLALVYPATGLEVLCESLARYALAPLTALPVVAARDDAARVLVAAGAAPQNGGRTVCRHEPPLVLRAAPGGTYTDAALAFCPWLASRPWGHPESGKE